MDKHETDDVPDFYRSTQPRKQHI